MKTWNWIQPGNRIWKVISDYEIGIISVFDEKGKLIMKHKGLTKEAMKMIEKSFLNIVAPKDNNILTKTKNDPMFA